MSNAETMLLSCWTVFTYQAMKKIISNISNNSLCTAQWPTPRMLALLVDIK